MNTLEDLILEAEKLEKEASTIQISTGSSPVGSNWSKESISQFVEEYHTWYANCLANLPEDLKDKFRSAYEKPSWVCIKRFLESPIEIIHQNISSGIPLIYLPAWKYPYEIYFRKPFFTQKQILIEASKRPSKPSIQASLVALAIIECLTKNFHLAAYQLNQRHNKRPPLATIQDEYDVQDFFHVLLSLFFEDIRPEEWTPSYAGKSSRTDFLLKSKQIMIEIKKTREGLDAKVLSDQLIIDKARYDAIPIIV